MHMYAKVLGIAPEPVIWSRVFVSRQFAHSKGNCNSECYIRTMKLIVLTLLFAQVPVAFTADVAARSFIEFNTLAEHEECGLEISEPVMSSPAQHCANEEGMKSFNNSKCGCYVKDGTLYAHVDDKIFRDMITAATCEFTVYHPATNTSNNCSLNIYPNIVKYPSIITSSEALKKILLDRQVRVKKHSFWDWFALVFVILTLLVALVAMVYLGSFASTPALAGQVVGAISRFEIITGLGLQTSSRLTGLIILGALRVSLTYAIVPAFALTSSTYAFTNYVKFVWNNETKVPFRNDMPLLAYLSKVQHESQPSAYSYDFECKLDRVATYDDNRVYFPEQMEFHDRAETRQTLVPRSATCFFAKSI